MPEMRAPRPLAGLQPGPPQLQQRKGARRWAHRRVGASPALPPPPPRPPRRPLPPGSDVSDEDAEALGLSTAPPEFYDPEADTRDEEWVGKMRRGRKSDAILSCPLCFTTLCVDCQQHVRFENQFRSLFVMNCRCARVRVCQPCRACAHGGERDRAGGPPRPWNDRGTPCSACRRVKTSEVVKVQQPPPRKGRQQRRRGDGGQQAPPAVGAPAAQGEGAAAQQPLHPVQQPQQQDAAEQPAQETEERLNPVLCAVCETEVGLRSIGDGIFHFFNAVASNS